MNSRLLYEINRHKSYGDVSGDVSNLVGVSDYDVLYMNNAKCAIVVVDEKHVQTVKQILKGKHGYKFISSRTE